MAVLALTTGLEVRREGGRKGEGGERAAGERFVALIVCLHLYSFSFPPPPFPPLLGQMDVSGRKVSGSIWGSIDCFLESADTTSS